MLSTHASSHGDNLFDFDFSYYTYNVVIYKIILKIYNKELQHLIVGDDTERHSTLLAFWQNSSISCVVLRFKVISHMTLHMY